MATQQLFNKCCPQSPSCRGGGGKLYKGNLLNEGVVIKEGTIKQGCIEMHPFLPIKTNSFCHDQECRCING